MKPAASTAKNDLRRDPRAGNAGQDPGWPLNCDVLPLNINGTGSAVAAEASENAHKLCARQLKLD